MEQAKQIDTCTAVLALVRGNDEVFARVRELRDYLQQEQPVPKVVIEVEDGLVTVVMANTPDLNVTVRDWADIVGGLPDPLAEFANANGEDGSMADVDWVAAGYPFEVW